ncbi:MAG: haloacid dehalogenase-like hydrolase [Candidatus Poribacteria bacterium]|nr:haloacid dehalogenase-like hydrolase [Candidatus Poribacteria bacterium]
MNIDEFPTYPPARFLPGTSVEIRDETTPRGRIRSALFDFDGTISLVRTGWQDVMVPMMVELLAEHTDESTESLERLVHNFVDRLTGKQTIFQMERLAEEIRRRGGKPLDPLAYKAIYNDRLMEVIASRREGLRDGSLTPQELTMPRTHELLDGLRERSVTLYLASGTDFVYVKEEAELLDVADYFDGGIYAALDRIEDFSKAMVIQQMFREHELNGAELVSFGDGYVEILNTKEVGGIAIGVASDEVGTVEVNEWKRNRLIQAGANLIVPGYQDLDALFAYLFDEPSDKKGA